MRWPWTSRMRLPAKPPSSASRILTGSTPLRRASRIASATPSKVSPTTIWLQHLTTWPAPWPPTWTMLLPSTSNSGRTFSKIGASPPTMMESVPSFAPVSPPDTGASSMCTPRSASAAAMRRGRRHGAHVDDGVAGAGAVHQAAVAEDDLLDVGGVGNDGEADVGFGGDFGRRALAECAGDQHRLESVEAATVNEQLMPGAEQILRHRAAHDAAADKSDLHDASPFTT